MTPPTKKQLTKIQRQKADLRRSLWPDLDEGWLWEYTRSDGWLNVPRALPLLLQIMDTLSKGKPVSATYLDLWCRTFNDSFVVASKPREMAFFSGFTGERAERTWAGRMRILRDLDFIDVQEGPNGPLSYVLIWNPYLVIKEHEAAKRVDRKTFNALRERMIEIGAGDLQDPSTTKRAPAVLTDSTDVLPHDEASAPSKV